METKKENAMTVAIFYLISFAILFAGSAAISDMLSLFAW